jgi:SH3-like domain-containing protein
MGLPVEPKPRVSDADALRAELSLRERELQIKADEVELKRSEAAKSSRLTPILIAIWTTAVAAGGNGIVSWFNGQQLHKLETEKAQQLHQLETEKAQSAVILEVVKTNSPDKAANNLAFLIDIGVISEQQASTRLRTYLKTRVAGQGPSIAKDGTSGETSINDADCANSGDYVVVNVHWGDDDGGLNIRTGPNQTQIGVIPATGTGIEVNTCSAGWCQVRYKCFSGWAFAQHLALRSTRLARVKGVTEATLKVRRDPGQSSELAGALAANATGVVKHVCQSTPLTGAEQWCHISAGKTSGWVPLVNLEDQALAQVSSRAEPGGQTSSEATPAATAPAPPEQTTQTTDAVRTDATSAPGETAPR